MKREQILAVLYDIALAAGSEVHCTPLLNKVLQRFLFHTGFPAGVVLMNACRQGGAYEACLAAAIGDRDLIQKIKQRLRLPESLFANDVMILEGGLAAQALGCRQTYSHCLRLPIDAERVMLLFSTRLPDNASFLTRLFQPLLRSLSKTIDLCLKAESETASIASDRDQARSDLLVALASSEQERILLRNLMNTLPDLVWLKDTEGRYITCNPAFERFFDASEAEIIGKTDYDFVKAELADFFRSNDCAAIASATPLRNEEWLRFADGSREGWFETTKTALKKDDGTLLGVIGIAHDITERKAAADSSLEHARELQESIRSTIEAVGKIVEYRDPYTAGHQRRVGTIASAIARELGWDKEHCEQIELIGYVHDVGQIAVPAELLVRPAALSALEFRVVQEHVNIGREILKDIKFPIPIATIVYQHHERIDGSGYPTGLKGEQICIEARVIAVADVIEAMSSHRPYRPAHGTDAALREIEQSRGIRYDPDVADAALRLFREQGFTIPD